ncbi:MAG: hypothetical protein WCP28_20730, partial [Actinomycetes bacterium]
VAQAAGPVSQATINAIINVPGTVGPGKPSAQQIVTGLLAGLPVLLDKIAAQLLGGPCHTGAKLPTDGIKQIACGGKALAAGAATLSAGIGTYPGSESDQNTLVGGAMALAAGASTLSNTVDGTLAPGAALIADGTVALPASLTAASEGAGQLATGLGAAVTGVGAIQDGAGQLKAEGSDKLATTGEKAQLGYATDVATINALQQVGVSGTAIPYGPATGPNVQTTGVYQLTLPAASTGGSNALLYGLAVLGLLIGGALVAVAWRRRA